MVTTYERQITPSPATDDTIAATHINSEIDYIIAALNDFDASNCKKSGTSIPLGNITGLTSSQMAAAFFLDENNMASNSATAVSSQQAIKKFVDDTVGDSYRLIDVNGSSVKVYTKYLTGTTGAGATTNVAHGITGIDNILSATCAIFGSSQYVVVEIQLDANANSDYIVGWDATNIIIGEVGTTFRSSKYRIKIDYIL